MGTPYGVVRDVNAILTPPNWVVNGVPRANVPTPPYKIWPVDDDQRWRRAINEGGRQQVIGGCRHPRSSTPGSVIPAVARPPVTVDVRAVQKTRIACGLIDTKTTVDGKGKIRSAGVKVGFASVITTLTDLVIGGAGNKQNCQGKQGPMPPGT
jgi:hypothetical protein